MIDTKWIPERIIDKIDFAGANGCWEWKAYIHPSGYGRVWLYSKLLYAHRVIYEILVKHVPINMECDHLCRNRKCVNPEHIEVVTSKINSIRGNGFCGTNARKTHCDNGHEFNETNTYTYKHGRRQCKICKKLNHHSWIAKIDNGYKITPRIKRAHCGRGHEYTPDNTYVNPRGIRSCKLCRNIHSKSLRERRKKQKQDLLLANHD